MTVYVYSTLASGNDYVDYQIDEKGAHTPIRKVSIKGGAGVANRILALAGEALTPPGVMTEISDGDYEFLQTNETFKTHVRNGFIKCVQKIGKLDKVVIDMNAKDASRPLTEDDTQKGGRLQSAKLHSVGATIE